MTLEEAKRRYPAVYTIYERPKDFPEEFVVRRWYGEVAEPNTFMRVSADVPDAMIMIRQQLMRLGLVALYRELADDPAIVESWI